MSAPRPKPPENIASQAAKVMHQTPKKMGGPFPPFRLFDAKTMAKDLSPLEYHPGAIKFFKEAGIWTGK